MAKPKPHVMFRTNGDGKWFRTEFPDHCPFKIFMMSERKPSCQGILGHNGDHWCYAPDGSYCQDRNEEERPIKSKFEGVSSQTPPGHKNWVSPVDKQKEMPGPNAITTEVTDPKEIKRLNKGKIKKNESLTQPVRLEKESKKLQKHLKEYDEYRKEHKDDA